MSMILFLPSIFVASGIAWLITRRTGPLRWWYWAAPVQVVLNLLWNVILGGYSGLGDRAALPLASLLALLTIALMSAGLWLVRRDQRPHDDPRSRVILRAARRQALIALALSYLGAVVIIARYQRRAHELSVMREEVMASLDRDSVSRASLDANERLMDALLAQDKSDVKPRQAWSAARDRAAELERMKESFILLMGVEFPSLDARPGVAEALPFADDIVFELSVDVEGISLVGRGDIYLTDRGALYLLRLADRASQASPRSAFSRAAARIEASLPRNVDAAPDRYIDLDRSWRRVTDPLWPPGSVMVVRIARHRSRVECSALIAIYLDRTRYLDLIGAAR